MPLTDYLYTDFHRLDSYFEQVSDPVKYDKVPVWKAGLGLTGPSAEGEQSRHGRSYTAHEKVQKLLDYLRRSGLIERGRLDHPARASEPPFRIELMTARRAHIPPSSTLAASQGLNLWMSLGSEAEIQSKRARPEFADGALFLLEEFVGSDTNRPFTVSAYSWLAMLAETVDRAMTEAIRGEAQTPRSPLVHDLDSRFASDPVEALTELGAVFGPKRRVGALYRVRASCISMDLGRTVTCIGYPIVVTDDRGILE